MQSRACAWAHEPVGLVLIAYARSSSEFLSECTVNQIESPYYLHPFPPIRIIEDRTSAPTPKWLTLVAVHTLLDLVGDAVALQRPNPHVLHRTYRVRLHNMICGDHPRFVVVFLGMYLSCRDPLAIHLPRASNGRDIDLVGPEGRFDAKPKCVTSQGPS